MRVVAPFYLSLSLSSYYFIEFPFPKYEISTKILYLFLFPCAIRWKKSGATRTDDADLI